MGVLRLMSVAALSALFVLQAWKSLSKLRSGRVGVSEAFRPAENFSFPDVSLCNFDIKEDVDNLLELMDEARRSTDEIYLGVVDTELGRHLNLRNSSVLRSLGFSPEKVWSEHLILIPNHVVHCVIYHPQKKSKQFGFPNQLKLMLDLRREYLLGIMFHRDGRFFPAFSHVLDLDFRILPTVKSVEKYSKNSSLPPMRTFYEIVLELSLTERESLPTEDRPCTTPDKNNYHVTVARCFREWVQNKVGCILPWGKNVTNSTEICSSNEQMKVMMDKFQAVSEMTDRRFVLTTGCEPRCHAHKYSSSIAFAHNVNIPARRENVNVSMYFSRPQIKTESEVVLYDLTTFLAEIGGYLGLLVGVSLLDVVAFCEGAYLACSGWMGCGNKKRRRRRKNKDDVPALSSDG